MSIAQEIHDYIVEKFRIEIDEDFNNDVNLFDYGYVDSLDAMTILSDLEKNYKIEITQRDLMLYPMTTINEIAEAVESKLGN